jgi:glycosyltransferase involved in cell wall biosynthesis
LNELISVILPVFNERLEWLNLSIESILNQQNCNFELIIVNDNPEDNNLKKALDKYCENSRIRIIYNKENIGIVGSLNKAISVAKGVYIARMDADDISLPNRLNTELQMMLNDQVDFIMTGVEQINEEGTFLSNDHYNMLSSEKIAKRLKYKSLGAHPTWLVKKVVFDCLNGYRNIQYAEDLDFGIRALESGYKLLLIPDITLQYRIRENSITQSKQVDMMLIATYIRKIYRSKKYKLIDIDTSTINNASKQIQGIERIRFKKFLSKRRVALDKIRKGQILNGVTTYLLASIVSFKYLFYFNNDVIYELNHKIRKF